MTVRQLFAMVATPQGDIFIACSGEYKEGMVRVGQSDFRKEKQP